MVYFVLLKSLRLYFPIYIGILKTTKRNLWYLRGTKSGAGFIARFMQLLGYWESYRLQSIIFVRQFNAIFLLPNNPVWVRILIAKRKKYLFRSLYTRKADHHLLLVLKDSFWELRITSIAEAKKDTRTFRCFSYFSFFVKISKINFPLR